MGAVVAFISGEEGVDALGLEMLGAALHPDGAVLLRGALSEVQAGGDLPMGKALQFVEEDDIAVAGRDRHQGFDGMVEEFLVEEGLGGVGGCIYDERGGRITPCLEGGNPFATEGIERKVLGHFE
jgi:hypothetical protein